MRERDDACKGECAAHEEIEQNNKDPEPYTAVTAFSLFLWDDVVVACAPFGDV